MSDYIRQNEVGVDYQVDDIWTILNPIEQSIKNKMETIGTPLKNWDISINYGIKTGCNEAFIIDGAKRDEILANCKDENERKRTAEIIRPILRGRDIERYSYKFAGLYLISTHDGYYDNNRNYVPKININHYPAIKAHLAQYWEQISVRTDKGETPYNLRSCAYMDDFSQQKIVYSEIVRSPQFYLDKESQFMVDATSYCITGENLDYLIDWLNSSSISWCFKRFYTVNLGEQGYRYQKAFIENLPIPKPKGEQNYHNNDNLIYKTLDFTQEEINFVSSKVNP